MQTVDSTSEQETKPLNSRRHVLWSLYNNTSELQTTLCVTDVGSMVGSMVGLMSDGIRWCVSVEQSLSLIHI